MADQNRAFSPEQRTGVYYATLFMSSGVWTVLGSIWLDHRGLTSGEIGVIASTPVLLMLVLNLVVGRIADRASDWRSVIVFASLLSALTPFGLIFADGFWGLLIVWTLASMSQLAVGPVIDAAALRLCQANGSDFATLRGFGTVGYLALLVSTGYFAKAYGPEVFLPLFIVTSLARGATALWLPKFRSDRPRQSEGAKRLVEVLRFWFLLPLVGWAMVFATHLILNQFQNLLWQKQGIPLDRIGLLIAVSALAETAMFFTFRRVASRYSQRLLLLISGTISILRWIAMAFDPPLAALVALQLLHAVTFAMGFIACLGFIAKWTSEDIAAEAQGLFVMLQQGMSVLAIFVFGRLIDLYGSQAYWFSALVALMGTGLIALSMVMRHPSSGKAQ